MGASGGETGHTHLTSKQCVLDSTLDSTLLKAVILVQNPSSASTDW